MKVRTCLGKDLGWFFSVQGGLQCSWNEESQQLRLLHSVSLDFIKRDDRLCGTRGAVTRHSNRPFVEELDPLTVD